jgi:hypothetical protein
MEHEGPHLIVKHRKISSKLLVVAMHTAVLEVLIQVWKVSDTRLELRPTSGSLRACTKAALTPPQGE